MAISDSPVRQLWQARCGATRLDEQAVSKLKLGPFGSNSQEIRFANDVLLVPLKV